MVHTIQYLKLPIQIAVSNSLKLLGILNHVINLTVLIMHRGVTALPPNMKSRPEI